MKKALMAIVLSIILLWNLFLPVYATESSYSIKRNDFADGSYFITIIIVDDSTGFDSIGAKYVTSGTAYNHYYNSNNILQFSVSVKGTFTYDCSNAWATSAHYGYQISNTNWSFVSGSASCSGATATATCTFHNTNGSNKTLSVSLTCSPLGVLS